MYGLIIMCKVFAISNNFMLASYRSSRQSKLLRKRKHVMAHQLRRKARSVWFQKGKTGQWWRELHSKCACAKFSARAGKIAITWEISACLPGLKIVAPLPQGGPKFQPGLAFQPGLEVPHVIVNLVLERDDWSGGLSFQPGWPGWKLSYIQPLRVAPSNAVNSFSYTHAFSQLNDCFHRDDTLPWKAC